MTDADRGDQIKPDEATFDSAERYTNLAKTESEPVPPEQIRELEKLDISPHLKVELLLIQLGLKPATDETYRSPSVEHGHPNEPIEDQDTYEALVKYLDLAGLPHHTIEYPAVGGWHQLMRGSEGARYRQERPELDYDSHLANDHYYAERIISIGRTPEDVALMEAAERANDSTLFGQAYGFPKTAIDAYVAQDGLLTNEQIDELVSDPELLDFVQSRLSVDHWQEELAVIKQQLEAVRAASPTILKQYQDNLLRK